MRCDWPLCDIWFKSYEHFKIKMFLGEASYRPRTGLVQALYRRLLQAPGKKAAPWRLCAYSHLGALRCQQLYSETVNQARNSGLQFMPTKRACNSGHHKLGHWSYLWGWVWIAVAQLAMAWIVCLNCGPKLQVWIAGLICGFRTQDRPHCEKWHFSVGFHHFFCHFCAPASTLCM